ncbi:hypothetical protein QF036_000411 [Arthrobacter globiformis]|nr:hypothetical protein [Arthrobacter globiformis]
MTTTGLTGRFDGKTALVTGAGGGIGSAISRRLSAEGAHVFICDVNEAAAKEVADGLVGEGLSPSRWSSISSTPRPPRRPGRSSKAAAGSTSWPTMPASTGAGTCSPSRSTTGISPSRSTSTRCSTCAGPSFRT